MDGPGSDPEADPGCSSDPVPAASNDWYEFLVQPTDGESFDRAKTVTWTIKGVRGTQNAGLVCFGASYEFNAIFEDSSQAPPGRLPDGTQGFVGMLNQCSRTEGSPCISSYTITPDETTGLNTDVAVISIPAGLNGDPFMGK
jgi:hypothetical protein